MTSKKGKAPKSTRDKRKVTLDLPGETWDEIKTYAQRLDISASKAAQWAWKIARHEIAKLPGAPIDGAPLPVVSSPPPVPSTTPSKPQSPTSPTPKLASPPASPRAPGRSPAPAQAQDVPWADPLDEQARALWGDEWPTI